MRNIKMTVQYDGSRYNGWQKQKQGESTIQFKIEAVLTKMAEEKVMVVGCGRTDVGVHAENYVANFHTNCKFTIDTMLDYLYEFLPEDIVVKSLEDVGERFHAGYNVKSKTYVYTINNNKFRDVFTRRYVYQIEEKLNSNEMKKAAEVLIGEHDFKGFTNLKTDTKTTIRTINYINITQTDGIIEIEFNGDGFLLNMERIIAGTLIAIGSGKIKISDVEKVLNEKKREEFGPIAKAKGLCLKSVEY
ncbi:tRNA pseudouridine(38-40) synthase TruA [Clostridium akagii]|uniref:tRNA pseudouridine(38-40) synthase TruA n=1 Tax=Clostridium akagii TaxID=91623 RepID=UPI00047BF747|nr:tRNA pseudouridine(38-40) synthase TruA [Clostridium akagii]